MDKELRDKWVAALRSGEYQQGKGYLKDIDGYYCCLGVCADVINKDAWVHNPDVLGDWSWNGEMDSLPEEIVPDEIQSTLIRKNDDMGESFSEIADWIEENIPVE